MVIAVDFDGTLVEDLFPYIGRKNNTLFKWLMRRQNAGDTLILWTCRQGERLQEAVKYCEENQLFFDCINKNADKYIKKYGNDCRKIFADVYIDDKAINVSCFEIFNEKVHL